MIDNVPGRESDIATAALKVENRMLKTLVQEGRATVAQEARLTQVRNELANIVGASR